MVWGSRPALTPRTSASATATVLTCTSMLFTSFMARPWPRAPTWKTCLPMASKRSLQAATVSGAPPTMMDSSPEAARSVARRRATKGSMVLMQTTMWPRRARLATPRSPAMTASAWAVVSTMQMVRSTAAATLSADSTMVAPRARHSPVLTGSMSCATSAKPCLTRLAAMGPPMAPSPMNPTVPDMAITPPWLKATVSARRCRSCQIARRGSTRRLASHHGDRVVQPLEDPLVADHVREPVTGEIRSQRGVRVRDENRDPSRRELLDEGPDYPGRRIVEGGDGARVHDQPAHGRWGLLHEGLHVLREAGCVGVEEVGAELEDHEARLALGAGPRGDGSPVPALLNEHRSVRPIAVAHVMEERQRHGQHDACPHAYTDHHGRRDRGEGEFGGALAPDVPQASQVHQTEGDSEHDGPQHAAWQVLEGAGEEKKDEGDRARRDDMGELATAARALHHGGLGRAPVDHEGPAHGRRRVGRA